MRETSSSIQHPLVNKVISAQLPIDPSHVCTAARSLISRRLRDAVVLPIRQ